MDHRILLIGVNAYPGCPLEGCINDIDDANDMIVNHAGIPQSCVHALKDRDATTANWQNELRWLAGTPSGCKAYLHNSGHGVAIPGADKVHDAICPVDFDWSPGHMITDSQFVQIFSSMAPGVLFNWVSDSCHSGDLDRDFFSRHAGKVVRPKRIMPPPGIHAQIQKLKAAGAPRGMLNGQLDVGFMSGCRSDQTSADTEVNGRPCGAYTHFYLQALLASMGAPWTNICSETVMGLQQNGYDQVPCASGARAGRPFLA